jgi:hypothetical protein
MPAQTTCPISGVDRALSSYINSREDTLRIRRTLSKYLTASLRPVNSATQNQHLNHECPQSISATSTNPPGLKGQRLEYLLALRAKSQAEARHRELQQSLEDLHTRHVEETPTYTQSEHNNEATGGYVALLRQRRKHAELEVVQDALDRLLSAKPIHTLQDPKALVQQTIGEQPDLPAERLQQDSQSHDEQSMIFKLKQEVLEARASMDRANSDRAQAQSKAARSPPELQQQVHALERARDEIVDWVQDELAKLEEDSVFLEDASPIKRSAVAAPIDLSSADSQIRNAYNQYTLARASLIESWGALDQPLQPPANDENELKEPTDSDKPHENKKPVMSTIRLLPHLPHLARSAQIERPSTSKHRLRPRTRKLRKHSCGCRPRATCFLRAPRTSVHGAAPRRRPRQPHPSLSRSVCRRAGKKLQVSARLSSCARCRAKCWRRVSSRRYNRMVAIDQLFPLSVDIDVIH